MSILGNSPTLPHPKGNSVMKNTPTNSGSRPTSSRHAIPTSAPSEPRTLGRAPAGWLGDTQKKEAPLS